MLSINNLCLRAGNFRVRNVALEVGASEYFVLMGQTGSGKSLLVKAVCGLIRAESGRVIIDDRDVTDDEPRRRRVGYVPQDSGLFPHLNVEGNLVFSLRARGMRRGRAVGKVAPIIESLGIGDLLKRSTVNLSGGETQKVALGRALASDPALLVLDEPVSALDEPTRREICGVLRRVQRQFGVSTIHVCHSLGEARSVADRVGIMHAGRLVQTGEIDELAANPANDAVARLVSPAP